MVAPPPIPGHWPPPQPHVSPVRPLSPARRCPPTHPPLPAPKGNPPDWDSYPLSYMPSPDLISLFSAYTVLSFGESRRQPPGDGTQPKNFKPIFGGE